MSSEYTDRDTENSQANVDVEKPSEIQRTGRKDRVFLTDYQKEIIVATIGNRTEFLKTLESDKERKLRVVNHIDRSGKDLTRKLKTWLANMGSFFDDTMKNFVNYHAFVDVMRQKEDVRWSVVFQSQLGTKYSQVKNEYANYVEEVFSKRFFELTRKARKFRAVSGEWKNFATPYEETLKQLTKIEKKYSGIIDDELYFGSKEKENLVKSRAEKIDKLVRLEYYFETYIERLNNTYSQMWTDYIETCDLIQDIVMKKQQMLFEDWADMIDFVMNPDGNQKDWTEEIDEESN